MSLYVRNLCVFHNTMYNVLTQRFWFRIFLLVLMFNRIVIFCQFLNVITHSFFYIFNCYYSWRNMHNFVLEFVVVSTKWDVLYILTFILFILHLLLARHFSKLIGI